MPSMVNRGRDIILPGPSGTMPGGGNPVDWSRETHLEITHLQIVPMTSSVINDPGAEFGSDSEQIGTVNDWALAVMAGAVRNQFTGYPDTPLSAQIGPTKVNELAGVPPSANPNRII